MKNLILLIVTVITSTHNTYAQEIEMYNGNDDAIVSLKANADIYGSDALIYLHRSDRLGKSLIRYDLNALESGIRDAAVLGEQFWDLGIKKGNQFQLSYYTATENLNGSLNGNVQNAIVVDKARGREETFEVEFPQGIIRIGDNLTVGESGAETFIETSAQQNLSLNIGEELQISADEVRVEAGYMALPGAQLTSNSVYPSSSSTTLGTSCSPWSEIWFEDLLLPIEDCERVLEWQALKANASSIKRFMAVGIMQGLTENNESVINIEPTSLAAQFPEAVHMVNVIRDGDSAKVVKKVAGIKINVIFPILIQAIQEQQEMITALQVQITAQE